MTDPNLENFMKGLPNSFGRAVDQFSGGFQIFPMMPKEATIGDFASKDPINRRLLGAGINKGADPKCTSSPTERLPGSQAGAG